MFVIILNFTLFKFYYFLSWPNLNKIVNFILGIFRWTIRNKFKNSLHFQIQIALSHNTTPTLNNIFSCNPIAITNAYANCALAVRSITHRQTSMRQTTWSQRIILNLIQQPLQASTSKIYSHTTSTICLSRETLQSWCFTHSL